jgi:hypothetical protein
MTGLAPVTDLRYFYEEANSDTDLTYVKAHAERLLKESPLTGLKREIGRKARGVLEEIMNL